MEAPLKGIRVLEVANWLAIPSCAAMMADMGADVIKVEALQGDTFRTEIRDADFAKSFPTSYAFELDNRGKRSIALNLARPKAVEAVHKLASKADIFMTNLIPRRQEAFNLTYEELSKDHPRLIYVSFNGYGTKGPDKDRTGFDYTAFWTRSGAMSLFSRPGKEPVNLRSGFGDHTSSPMLLAGVMTALWAREKTGRGQKVATSLLNMGLWVIGGDLSRSLYARQHPFQWNREESPNPLQNTYQTADGKWINMVSPNTNEKWARFCRALQRDDLITDERYSEPLARRANARELIPELDRVIGSNTLDELSPRLDAEGVIWAPMQDLMDVMSDPQVRANDFIVTVDHPTHGPYETLATPLKFSESEIKPRGAAPEMGQHTEQVLVDELGYSWDDVETLREDGAIN